MMAFELPRLPYGYDALEPVIDAQTMEIHHTKHHQMYVDKLNKALEGHEEHAPDTIEEILCRINDVPEDIRTAVRNHGGGHANHSLFWELLCPIDDRDLEAEKQAKHTLEKVLTLNFGSLDAFKTQFEDAATTHFGSGWAWFVKKPSGKLAVYSKPNQDSPLMDGDTPLLGLDVWEHAYYLKYQNRRPDYIEAWWNLVNWKKVAELWKAAA
ncbi:superoxide dismutase [Candidatus Berkelbacteria bacterium]|nr:superoxide dismutase [Candidatus Berkelbacteria bacterium]